MKVIFSVPFLLLLIHQAETFSLLLGTKLSTSAQRDTIRYKLHSTTQKDETTHSLDDDDDSDKNSSNRENNDPGAQLAALERLLARQKADIKMTETLLETLKNPGHIRSMRRDALKETNIASFASSIAAGFDYGFVSRSEGATFAELNGGIGKSNLEAIKTYGGPPANVFRLGTQQFIRNWNAIKGEYKDEVDVHLTPKQVEMQQALESLTLNSTAIWEREGPIEAPLVIKVPYLVLCFFLDTVFEGKYVPNRFFLLETVARMPYFSYITMLHLYETLGFWRRSADMKRIHFAEEINEYRHLLIMESLGGDQAWWVRFLAQHSAIVYYIVLCLLWGISPSLSYKFSELLETHAVNTYGQFLDENIELLEKLPPSLAAVEYYCIGASDPFYAEFQTSSSTKEEIRRPGENMKSLYDTFRAIQADEADHVSTMKACLDPDAVVRSPSLERKILTGIALVTATSLVMTSGDVSVFDGSVVDGVDAGVAAGGDVAIVDALIAGVAALASRVVGSTTETVGAITDVVSNTTPDSVVPEEVLDGIKTAVESADLDELAAGIAGIAASASEKDAESKATIEAGSELLESGAIRVFVQNAWRGAVEAANIIGRLLLALF